MANHDLKYFYEDEVFRVTKKGNLQFGMVIEDAEYASSDDESSDEDEPPVKAGQIRVAWYPSGTEEVVGEKKVHLADRSLMPGDVVRRMVAGKSTQRGYCKDVHVYATVQIIGTQQVIYGVKSASLTPLETFKSDILVCMDGWVGMVRNVKACLTVRFNDGSKVIIEDVVAEELDDIRDKRDPECEFKRYDFYPGQILFGAVRSLESGQWLDCSAEVSAARKHKPHKGYKVTVEEIDFKSIGVSWMCRAYFSSGNPGERGAQPKYKVEGESLKRVKMLNVFEPCTLQIGDRNFYTMQDNDLVMMKGEWKKLQKELLLKGKKKDNPKTTKTTCNDTLEVGDDDEQNSSDFEDVEDGDSDGASVSSHGSSSQNIDTLGLVGDAGQGKKKNKSQPGLMTKVLKKKQKLKKTKKNTDRVSTQLLVVKPGDRVVTETLSTKSEVDVVWQDGSVEKAIPSSDLYPIHHLDDHEFFPGDYVTEAKDGFHPHSYGVVQDVDHAGRCCRVKWFRTYTEGSQPQPIYVSTQDASAYDLKDHPDFKYRPGSIVIRVMNSAGDDCGLGAGQVLDNQPSGQVSVWWAGEEGEGGVKSSCWPQDLYKVGEYDSDEGELWEDEDDEESGNDSWETEEEQEGFDEEIKEEDLHTDDKDLKPKLAANIEKARIAMTRLEEIFGENPFLQTPDVMRQLLDVYRDCRYLDRLMGTDFFDESQFSGLLDRIRDQDRISTVDAAVKEHVTRLFSTEASPGKDSGNGSLMEDKEGQTEEKSEEVKGEEVAECEVPDSQVCGRLCSMIKTQLVKSHKEVVRRFGRDPQLDSVEDLDLSLNSEIARDMAAKFNPSNTVFRINSDNILQLADGPDTPTARTMGVFMKDMEEQEIKYDKEVDKQSMETKNEENKLIGPSSTCLSPEKPVGPPLAPGSFQMIENVPDSHKFKLTIFQPSSMKNFLKTVKSELSLLQTSLPLGITVKGFEDRMDLYSVMIHGPKNTPYEDGLFFFDFQLVPEYPSLPPTCHYISYCSDRLNPNLYEDGKVCVSLLGTWSGKGTETWTPASNLLQVLVSIQGLILVSEPYFNEAGYEKQRGTQQGLENSRMYNEMAVLKMVQSTTRQIRSPHPAFQQEIRQHFKCRARGMIDRMLAWRKVSLDQLARSASCTPTTPVAPTTSSELLPDFPLIPASKGFCLTLDRAVHGLESALQSVSQEGGEVDLPLD